MFLVGMYAAGTWRNIKSFQYIYYKEDKDKCISVITMMILQEIEITDVEKVSNFCVNNAM